MFGIFKKKQIYSLVYVHGKFFNCTYLNTKQFPEGSLVVVDVRGEKYSGRILENSHQQPEGTKGVQFKEIIKLLEPEDRANVKGWNDVVDDHFASLGKESKMRPDIQKKYDHLNKELDNLIKTKNDRDKEKVMAIVRYLKGEIKFKKELGEIVERSIADDCNSIRNEIKEYLTSKEQQIIDDKINRCDSRMMMFHCLYERIDAKSRTIKEPNEYQSKYREKIIEDAIQTLLNRK